MPTLDQPQTNRLPQVKVSRRWLFISLVLFVMIGQQSTVASLAKAQDGTNSLVQQDFNNDNVPDVTTIAANFSSPRDRVTVYDTRGDMQWSESWETATDFDDDIWIFDAGANGTAELIIAFSINQTQTIAELFIDLNGDGDVSYQFENNRPVVTESEFPSLTVIADGDWTLPTGVLNWNVRFLIDGGAPISNRHPYSSEFQGRANLFFKGSFTLDGTPDIEHRFYDYDSNGVGDASIWQVLDDDLLSNTSASRTWIWRNTRNRGTTITPTVVFWPFLGSAGDPNIRNAINPRYFDIPPFVPVQWALATVTTPAWIGYPIEEGFHVHSYSPLLEDEVSYIAFENVQAYYDLAQDNDNDPELHIRHVYTDPAFDNANILDISTVYNVIRYSWNLNNNPNMAWDYKLGLLGRNPISGTVAAGDYTYASIPFESLPYWVMEQQWDIMTFVASEGELYSSSEGIYEWDMYQGIDGYTFLFPYIDGQYPLDVSLLFQIQDQSITETTILDGFRGEIAIDAQMNPSLYFSPIDRRLHLYRANYGLYATGPNSRVQYEDKNADGFMDTWTLFNNNDIFALLANTGTHLIFSDRGRTIIREVSLPPYIFTTLPPRDHEDWLAMREQVDSFGQAFELQDFNAMLTQYPGPQLQITGGRINQFRYTATGWRFELVVERTIRIIENNLNVNVTSLEAGRYLVEQTVDAGIVITELDSPRISFSLDETQLDLLSERQNFLLDLTVYNTGGQDLPNAEISGVAINEDGEEYPLYILNIPPTINSGEDTIVTLYWTPYESGVWQIILYITSEDRELVGRSYKYQTSMKVNVQPLEIAPRLEFLDLNNTIPYDGVTLIILAVTLSIMALITSILLLNYGRILKV